MSWQIVEQTNIPLLESLKSITVRQDILARVIHWQLAKRRQGTHCTKEEGDVSGSGKKLFRQKGTGNARQGARRAPHMRGGAVIFGPHPRSYDYPLLKKVRRLGLLHAVASSYQNDNLHVFKDLTLPSFKTRDVTTLLQKHFPNKNKILFVDDSNDNLDIGSRNVFGVKILPTCGLNVYDIVNHDVLVMTEQSAQDVLKRVS